MTSELLSYESSTLRPSRRRVGPFAVAAVALGLLTLVPPALTRWWVLRAAAAPAGAKVHYAFSPICYGAAVAAVALGALGLPRERRSACAIGITFGCVAFLSMLVIERLFR